MKIMQRVIMRMLPGKMGEGMKLLKDLLKKSKEYGFSPEMKTLRPFIGGGDAMHTVILEIE
jgi:hypothetical protein